MKKVVFLDRDGTINVDLGYVHKVEDWKFTARAPEALKKLQDVGFALAVVTNQSAIGEGLYDEAAVKELHAHMVEQLALAGVTLAAIAYCSHALAESCNCRKPETGMSDMVEDEIGAIDYAASWMIGDKPKDVSFGKRLGMQTALIRSRYWQDGELEEQPDMIVGSLFKAVEKITSS